MTLPEMLDDLPHGCDVGTKRNAKGYKESWIGYKLHIDAGDGGIPLSCILTSASVNDCQVAIPLATMTAARVTNLYDVMDAAYDAAEIRAHSESLGHVPIIDVNPRNSAALKRDLQQEAKARRTLGQGYAKDVRYRERSTVERVNGRLKDEFGARQVRVRGHRKVLCHFTYRLAGGESSLLHDRGTGLELEDVAVESAAPRGWRGDPFPALSVSVDLPSRGGGEERPQYGRAQAPGGRIFPALWCRTGPTGHSLVAIRSQPVPPEGVVCPDSRPEGAMRPWLCSNDHFREA